MVVEGILRMKTSLQDLKILYFLLQANLNYNIQKKNNTKQKDLNYNT